MKLHLLSGFLGSGKTTAIQYACNYLVNKNSRVGVITNDQGSTLVDGDFFKSLDFPVEQVEKSCFCCNYNELDKKIESLITTNNVDTIFAESVGSCTDLISTIFNPLSRFRPQLDVTVSTFVDAQLLYVLLTDKKSLFDEEVKYIFYKQIEEAGVIVVSKVDLIDASHLEELKELMISTHKNKIVHYQNSFNENNIQEWLMLLNSFEVLSLQSLDINYNIYGRGEAKLAWFDEELEIISESNNAIKNAENLINSIFNEINKNRYKIGHLKFLINGVNKVSFTSTTPVDCAYRTADQKTSTSTLLINARVQTTPEELSVIVSEAIKKEETENLCKIVVRSVSSFKPGYPKPTYRIKKVQKSGIRN